MLAAAALLALGWAHNDYENRRPLLDAVERGFCAVEADLHLQEGELRVAHRFYQTRPGRTLESLYLEPLKTLALPKHCATFLLVLDFKGKSRATLAAVERILERHEALLAPRGRVQALVSGSIPRKLAAERAGRLYLVDGRLSDVGRDPKVFPLVSAKLPRLWPIVAPGMVARAHAAGHKIRFWASRDEPWVWRELARLGVDYLCVDDLDGYSRWSSAAARAQ